VPSCIHNCNDPVSKYIVPLVAPAPGLTNGILNPEPFSILVKFKLELESTVTADPVILSVSYANDNVPLLLELINTPDAPLC